MRFYRQSLIGLFLVALTLGLLTLAVGQITGALRERAGDKSGGPPAQERVASVQVLPVVAGEVTPVIQAYGEVRARRSLEVRAPRAGRVVWTAPELTEGNTVAEGLLLVRLDQAEAQAALDLAMADLGSRQADQAQAAGRLGLARDELAAAETQLQLRIASTARQRDLSARGAGSASAVETAELAQSAAVQSQLSARQSLLSAEADLAEAEAAIRRQEIAVSEARRALADTEIRAGFTGVLNAVSVVEGGIVGASEQLATLIDPAALDLWVRLSTGQFAQLLGNEGNLPAASVTASLQTGGTTLRTTGTLVRAGAALAEGESGRLVIATLDEVPGFRPGDFVAVTIEEAPLAGAALLPGQSVGTDGTVLALASEDRLEAIPVAILRRQGDDVIVDAQPLDGREIVTRRTAQTGVGIKVRPLRGSDTSDKVALDADDRARLVALVEASTTLSPQDRAILLEQLSASHVPAELVAQITARAGG